MCKVWRSYPGVFAVTVLTILLVGTDGYAQNPSVTLVVKPSHTTILPNSDPIVISAVAKGTKLTFEWTLVGAGELEGDPTGSSVLYFPPETISRKTTRAVISINVKDYKDREVTESVDFTITTDEVPVQSPPSTPASPPNGELLFHENFEEGKKSLKGWEKTADKEKMEVMNCGEYGKCLMISRKDRNGITVLEKTFQNLAGTLRIEAMLKAEDVVKGTADYASGKFSVVVEKPGNTDWRQAHFYSNDFEGTFDWTLKSAEVVDLDGTKDVKISVGLQSSKGAVYIDEIKVYHFPE